MLMRPPRSTRTDTLFPYTTLCRSLPQHRGAAVGIAVELRLLRLVGGNGQRARAQRIIIGGKADHAVHAGGLGLATDVGPDLPDAGARLRVAERREGKEWVIPCRSRLSPYHKKKYTPKGPDMTTHTMNHR